MPQDAYKVVAMESRSEIPERLRSAWDRKCVKRTVMTIPYNAKPYSKRTYIRDALKEKGIEADKDELTVTVQAVRDAMHRVVPGPMKVMKWIEDEVSKAISRGVSEIQWKTPSDFIVNQKIMKKNIEVLELKLLGRCKINVATGDTDKVDKNRHKAATAPNLIHSLDASLLHIATMRFKHPIALIHDSVLCRATDMSILSTLVRETYMHLFAQHDYLKDFATQIGAETEPPIIGDLEPSNVLKSTYFFCLMYSLFDYAFGPTKVIVVSEERLQAAERRAKEEQVEAVESRISYLTDYSRQLREELKALTPEKEPQSLEEALTGDA